MELSVIIPTYGRESDLEDCLNSILRQSILPKEILIVDDTPDASIESLCKRKEKQFQNKQIDLFYIRNYKERSSAIARNIGIEHAKGNITLFLDSDVILDENYSKKIWEVYRDFPDAVGVQGYITNYKIPQRGGINKVFFLVHFETNCNRLLPSIQNVYAGPLTKIINCQWLVGNNCSYKRKILQEFRFDENLKQFSAGEDIDLSYRIYKKYPKGLFQTPAAKLIHKTSLEGRLPARKSVYMGQVHHTYIFCKVIDQNLKNKLIFLWSRVGQLIASIKVLMLKPSRKELLGLQYLINAYILCMRHIKNIQKGDIDFFKRTLK